MPASPEISRDAALAVPGAFEEVCKQVDLVISPDDGGQPVAMQRVEAAAGVSDAGDREAVDICGAAFDGNRRPRSANSNSIPVMACVRAHTTMPPPGA
jgi:hypothetical protein